jgi:hypothetical protein
MRRTKEQEKRFSRYAVSLGISVGDLEVLCQAASVTWDHIGYDCLQANGTDMTQDHVIEVVLDADNIVSNNQLPPYINEVLRRYDPNTTRILENVLREFVFVYKRYGM